MRRYDTIPKVDGFHVPGEFEPHAGCWMLWPQRPDIWRDGGKPAQKAFVEIAKAVRSFEPLTVGVNEDQYENAVYMLPDDIRVVELSSDDGWVRDSGPMFVRNSETGEVRGVDWAFNAWGGLVDGLYFPWSKDAQVARKICDMEYKGRYRLDDFVLEGGSVTADGEGTLITTEECLLSGGRNHDLSKEEITEVLCSYLGADKVIWLPNGLYLDPANGHVDNVCRFVKPGMVCAAWTEDEKDPRYPLLKENLAVLEEAADAHERALEIVKVELPEPVLMTEEEAAGLDQVPATVSRKAGTRLPASYVGFYIANGGLVVPAFGDPMDAKAVETLQTCFPERQIKQVPAREVLLGGGNIHGITLQQPASGLR